MTFHFPLRRNEIDWKELTEYFERAHAATRGANWISYRMSVELSMALSESNSDGTDQIRYYYVSFISA